VFGPRSGDLCVSLLTMSPDLSVYERQFGTPQ
jgi:hypothetical protein